MSEAKLTRKTKTLLDSLDNIYYNKISDRFTSGIPDIIGVYYGIPFYIELKDVGQKPRKLQEWHLKQADDAGAMTLSTDDYDKVVEFMNDIKICSSLA